jgi:NAD(P)-dependent dehydrogenase (short-subunit alcohol dehydrogenase family)
VTHDPAPPRVAIVTGASRGIGAGLVSGLRAAGYAVVGTARSMPPSDDPDVLAVEGDIARPETARRVVDGALERFGRIDSLVNNAGVFIGKPFTDYTADDFAEAIHVNLAGYFAISRLAVAQMLGQGRGHVVNVTTSLVDHANSAVPSVLASLTKGGLQSATKSLAIEYASRGVRANAVSLGVIQTPMHSADSYTGLADLHPIGRMGQVSDVVDGVLFLENAPFVTGEILHIDGGQSAGH